jgi:hypothetical protein
MSSIRAYKTFAVPRSTVDFLNQYNFKIPKQYQDCFQHYQLLYWSPEYLASQIKEGTITHAGTCYRVVWLSKPSQIKFSTQVALSFREAQDEFCISPAVLVKGV